MAHHQLIRGLVAEIRNLRSQLEQVNFDASVMGDAAYYAEQRATEMVRRAEYRAREAEREAENERYNREQLAEAERKAQRSESWGNDWEAKQIRERAHRFYG